MALTQEEREERRRQNRRDEKKRMAGDELLKGREEREAYRQSLLTDADLRNERIQNMKFHEGLEALPEDYDPIKVVTALKGSWGQDDLARYNDLFGGGGDPPADPPAEDINEPAPGVPTAPVDNGGDQVIKVPKNPIGGGLGKGGVSQIVQNDNDVINSFNNSSGFTYTQDNSVDQTVYGDSSRNFTYRHGGNNIASIYDVDPQSPVSRRYVHV